MAIPLDKLINFAGNEFELCNAVTAQTLKIFQKNKQLQQSELLEGEELHLKEPFKLISLAFEQILNGNITYRRLEEEV